jgi:polyhydroxyalkanoate synthesis regulator phasin
LKNVQDEATKRTAEAEKQVSSKVGISTRKAAKEFGLATKEEVEELFERIAALEEHIHGPSDEQTDGGEGTKKGRRKKSEAN